jgi:hypothetical protein
MISNFKVINNIYFVTIVHLYVKMLKLVCAHKKLIQMLGKLTNY